MAAAWRKKLLGACEVVAGAVSQTRSGAAHTVQLMMQDPAFRDTACAEALMRAKPYDKSAAATERYQQVQKAVDLLRGYAGKRL